jgi:hypothetical protein
MGRAGSPPARARSAQSEANACAIVLRCTRSRLAISRCGTPSLASALNLRPLRRAHHLARPSSSLDTSRLTPGPVVTKVAHFSVPRSGTIGLLTSAIPGGPAIRAVGGRVSEESDAEVLARGHEYRAHAREALERADWHAASRWAKGWITIGGAQSPEPWLSTSQASRTRANGVQPSGRPSSRCGSGSKIRQREA